MKEYKFLRYVFLRMEDKKYIYIYKEKDDKKITNRKIEREQDSGHENRKRN